MIRYVAGCGILSDPFHHRAVSHHPAARSGRARWRASTALRRPTTTCRVTSRSVDARTAAAPPPPQPSSPLSRAIGRWHSARARYPGMGRLLTPVCANADGMLTRTFNLWLAARRFPNERFAQELFLPTVRLNWSSKIFFCSVFLKCLEITVRPVFRSLSSTHQWLARSFAWLCLQYSRSSQPFFSRLPLASSLTQNLPPVFCLLTRAVEKYTTASLNLTPG